MKKRSRLLFLLPLASLIFAPALAGCGKDPEEQQTDKQDFKGLSLTAATVTYDGQPHTLELKGTPPRGAKMSYVEGHESGTLPGVYEIQIKVTCEGYNDKIFKANLTIIAAEFGDLAMEGASVHYDGQVHNLEVTGEIPEGAEVAYTVDGEEFTGASAVGTYEVTATVSLEGYTDATLNATLEILDNEDAEQNLLVEDFENLTNNDLADQWELLFYKDGEGWITPSSATLSLEKNQIIGDGQKTMKIKHTHQGAAFKATTELGDRRTFAKYEGFAIDTFSEDYVEDGTNKIQVQFWFKDLPLPEAYAGYANTYATYTLDANVQKGWTHWEVSFDDDTLSIASNATITQAFINLGYTVKDFSMYIEKVAVLATPNYKDGKNINTYVDNIKLLAEAPAAKVEERYIPNGLYANAQFGQYIALEFNDDMTEASLLFDGEESVKLTVEKLDCGLVFKDKDTSGTNLIVNATIEDGAIIADSFDGLQGPAFFYLEGAKFEKHSNINIDFTGVTTGQPLNDSNWYQEYWNDTWQQVSGKMNVRGDASNPHCNMTTGYYYDYRYTYTNSEKFGIANKFSADISNDYSGGSSDIRLKVKLIKSNGVETYLIGDESNYVVLPANTAKWFHIHREFDPVDVKAIQFVVKSTTGANQYLYFDNLKLGYEIPVEFNAGEFAVWNSASDAYKLTISDSLLDASFTKYGSDSSSPMSVDLDGKKLTLADKATFGAGLKIIGEVGDNQTIAVTEVTGTVGSLISASLVGKTFKKVASVDLDFADGTTDATYTNPNWQESKYQSSAWTDYATPTDMRSKVIGSNKIVNMHCGTGAKNFRYSPERPIGPVNHLEVDLGNYWGSSAGPARYKIALLASDGSTVSRYVAGDASNWASVEKSTTSGTLNHLSFDFDLTYAHKLRITTSMASGEAYLYMDNLKVSYKAPEPVVPVKTIEDGLYYIWNGNTDAFKMSIADSQTTGVVTKLGGDSYPVTVEVDGETVTFKDAGYAGAGLTIVATITAENEMEVTEVTGAMADAVSGSLLGKTVKHCADVSLDFEDGAGSGTYSNAHWTSEQYTDKWSSITPDMNSRSKNGSKVVNVVAGGYTRNFIYTPDVKMGPVNHIDLDMGNYYDGSAGDILVKIAIIDAGGTKYYALGSTDSFETIAKDPSAGLVHTQLNFNLCVGAKLQITVKCEAGSSYLYLDNINIYHA